MIRNFISVLNGAIERHATDEDVAALIARGATVIEIAPALACVNVRLYELDEDGHRFKEIL